MNIDKISKGYLNHPKFVKTYIPTMCKEISKKEEILSDGEKIINRVKETLTKGLEQRRPIKPLIQIEKEKKLLLEPILHSSNTLRIELSSQLAIISAKLDETSLRNEIYSERYVNIVEKYRTIWMTRQSEYEKLPVAVERCKRRTEFQLFDIGLMMCKQKKKEYEEMIMKKERINTMRLRRKIVEMVKMLQDRWAKQKATESLTKNCIHLKGQLEAIAGEKINLSKMKEEEERSKLRAKQLMPPPKLDLNFMKAFYITGKSNREHEIEKKRAIRFSSDSDDNASITTEIIEDMCRGNDDSIDIIEEIDGEKIESMPRSISGLVMRRNHQQKKNHYNNTINGIEVLEKTYRQLSLEKDDNYPEHTPIEAQVVIQNPEITSPRKLQSISRKSMDEPEGLLEVKRLKLEEVKEIDKRKAIEKRQEDKSEEFSKNEAPVLKKNRRLPQIQSIETINRPIAHLAKPLVAEIPPTPSNLFSPRHYTKSSFGSIDSFDLTLNQNFNVITGLETPIDNSEMSMDFLKQMNVTNFSPHPALESDTSFTSNVSAFKTTDEGQKSHQQTNNGDSNFTNFFQPGTSKTIFFM